MNTTTARLLLAALGTVALLGAATAAGADRGAQMKQTGISAEHVRTGDAPWGALTEAPARID